MERSPSGLWRLLGKQVDPQGSRGFESHSLRMKKATNTIKCRSWDGGFISIPEEKLELRVSAYGIIFNDEELLVMKQGERSQFSFPGGGINAGEYIKDGLMREIREETGLDVTVKEMLFFKEDMFFYNPLNQAIHGVLLFFRCETSGIALKAMNKETEVEIPLWTDYKDLNNDSFFGVNAEVFDQLKSYIND